MSILRTFLDKNVPVQLGEKWVGELCSDVTRAAQDGSIESVSNKADTIHKYVQYSDRRSINRSYEIAVRKILSRLNIKDVELAIDGTKHLYYGKNGGIFTRGIKYERGAQECWEYIVISIIKPFTIPIMAIPYHMGIDIAQACVELLDYAKSLPIRIKCVYFDRGFHNNQLIDYLESKNTGKPLPYLIFLQQNSAVKKYIDETEGKLGIFKQDLIYAYKKSKWKPQTTVVVCKDAYVDKEGKSHPMCFATNLEPRYSLAREYRKRWNIETGFRVLKSREIRTKSNDPIIRFFYFMLSCLLVLNWWLHNKVVRYLTYVRFIRGLGISFEKKYNYKPPDPKVCLL